MLKCSVAVVMPTVLATLTAIPVIADEINKQILGGTVVYSIQPYSQSTNAIAPIGTSRSESLLVNTENGGIANVIVSLTPNANIDKSVPKPKTVVMRARDTGFLPHVVVLRTGDTLQINNTGAVGCNISIRAIRNTPIDEVLSPGDQTTFTPFRPEKWPVSLTCNIKSSMAGWIAVSDSPHVAVSDENGRFQFRNVTPGEYDVTIWHEQAGAVNGVDLENDHFRATAKGYKVQIGNGTGDLGRVSLVERLFETD